MRTGWKSFALVLALVFAAPAVSGIAIGTAKAEDVTAMAAASLTDALAAIGAEWKKDSGNHLKAAYGASSALAKQVEQGAPADMFLSADLAWMDYLQERKLIDPATRSELLGNVLVIVAPKDSAIGDIKVDDKLDLAGLLKGGKLAVADTKAVPAGKYAMAGLTKLGLWPSVEGSLAQAENVRGALTLVERGDAPLGIVYHTDAIGRDAVKVVGVFPEGSHPRIVYPVALTTAGAAKPAAKAFLDYLHGGKAAAIFKKFGFIVL